MTRAAKCALTLFFATETDRAVILRRGPSRHTRMILWHRDTDRFEDGQWVRRKVYAERCRLSPDGRHFLYFMLDGQWKTPSRGSYTAISRPPYWTALALHPQGDTWGGGGWFHDNHTYYADGDRDIIGRAGGPAGLRWRSAHWREGRQRFRLQNPFRPTRLATAEDVTISPHPSKLGYATEGGRLFHLSDDGAATLIRDFTDMTFKPIRAPYDWRPETQTGRHP